MTAKHSSGTVSLQINNDTAVTTASGTIPTLTNAVQVGRYNSDSLCCSMHLYGLVLGSTFNGSESEIKTALGAKAGLTV